MRKRGSSKRLKRFNASKEKRIPEELEFSSKTTFNLTVSEENYAEEDVIWAKYLEDNIEEFDKVRESINYNFNVTINNKSQRAFPGCSMEKVDEPECGAKIPLKLSECCPTDQQSYIYSDPRLNRVRKGPNYKKNKKKQESKLALYDLIVTDSFESDRKILDISDYIKFPKSKMSKSMLPEFLVINTLVPHYKPKNPLLHKRKKDGKGINFIMIFKRAKWTDLNPTDPSILLFKRFIAACIGYRKSQDPKLRKMINRLKNILTVVNTKELRLGVLESRLLPKYNRTPWLIRYFLTTYKLGENFFEIDIDYHSFRYTTLQLGFMIFPKVKKAILDYALVIEAQRDGEMPERILCNARLFQVKLKGSPEIIIDSLGKYYEKSPDNDSIISYNYDLEKFEEEEFLQNMLMEHKLKFFTIIVFIVCIFLVILLI